MFKPGDRVKIIKKDDSNQGNCWDDEMDSYVGSVEEIFFVRGSRVRNWYGVFIKCENGPSQMVNGKYEVGWWFPENCLEITNQEEEPKFCISTECCPKCNVGLVEKYSEYAGETIKKCMGCGWC